jgi:hypothetical protein
MDDNKAPATLVNQFKTYAFEKFDENAPVLSDSKILVSMPSWIVILLQLMGYCVCIAVFVSFATTDYQTTSDKSYISLDHGPACDSVPLAVTNDFIANRDGDWKSKSTKEFLYSFSFLDMTADKRNYSRYYQESFETNIKEFSKFGPTRPTVYNLVGYMTHGFYFGDDREVQFTFLGTLCMK